MGSPRWHALMCGWNRLTISHSPLHTVRTMFTADLIVKISCARRWVMWRRGLRVT